MTEKRKAVQTQLVFYDDARARTFEPFALSRPLSEMRVGALLMRERWEQTLNGASASFVSALQLQEFSEENTPGFAVGVIPSGSLLVNTRAAIELRTHALAPDVNVVKIDGRVAAVRLREDLHASHFADGKPTLDELAAQWYGASLDAVMDVDGVWLEEVWDIIRHLSPLLTRDIPVLASVLSCGKHTGGLHPAAVPESDHAVWIERGAVIEPYTIFDTSNGPVLLRAGATVQAFTRVVGPCYIGKDSIVVGDRISGSAIGDTCRVHGELSATVFLGHSNKGHDGFVGHSIVGRWVNMGAGTITSNLKNTYGTVALWTPDGIRDTGLQFLGTLFGDHVKTGIGLKLTTGCVLGMAANVFNNMPPKVVEPFAWGSHAPYDSYDADKFVGTAARMMSRRHVDLTAEGRAYLLTVHAARWHAR